MQLSTATTSMSLRQRVKQVVRENELIARLAARGYRMLHPSRERVRGRNNRILADRALLGRCSFEIVGDNNLIEIGPLAIVQHTRFILRGSGHRIRIGAGCVFKAATLWLEDQDGTIAIGESTTIESAHIAATEPGAKITLGRDCMLAFDVDIRNGDSHSIIDMASGERINYARDITIGDHVWLGGRSQVLKGVTIGTHSIVGGSSVVTKSVPAHTLVVGVPARPLREGVTWRRERIYQRHDMASISENVEATER